MTDNSAKLQAKQEAMRQGLERRREREKAQREKARKLAATESTRQRRRRARKERKKLDALVKSSTRGGFRVGSGRRPDYFRRTGIKPISAHELLTALDVPRVLADLVNDKNPAIRLQTLNMLLNRAYGLPKETGEIQVTGDLQKNINVVFVSTKDGGEKVPLDDWRAQQRPTALLEGQTVTPESGPAAASQAPPPLPEPMGTCQYHGDFSLKESKGFNICPECKRDSERHERWLTRLQPGGGLQ